MGRYGSSNRCLYWAQCDCSTKHSFFKYFAIHQKVKANPNLDFDWKPILGYNPGSYSRKWWSDWVKRWYEKVTNNLEWKEEDFKNYIDDTSVNSGALEFKDEWMIKLDTNRRIGKRGFIMKISFE